MDKVLIECRLAIGPQLLVLAVLGANKAAALTRQINDTLFRPLLKPFSGASFDVFEGFYKRLELFVAHAYTLSCRTPVLH